MLSVLPKSLTILISEFEKLPGIGPKTAARLAYHLLKAPDSVSLSLSLASANLKKNIQTCPICGNLIENNQCPICTDLSRDKNIICVVEEPLDLLAIEKSGAYNGLYHILGGAISPINGIGPDELNIVSLINRLKTGENVKELILATNPNLEGEATSMYISQKVLLVRKDIHISKLARGLPMGSDLEYADNITLKKSLEGRSDY